MIAIICRQSRRSLGIDRMISQICSLAGKRIYVAGHRGMVGSSIVRALRAGEHEAITADRAILDLTNQAAVDAFMERQRPQIVFMAAARVGGIVANDRYPADFIYENLMIEANIIAAAHRVGVERLIFLASSCVYPKMADQPIVEASLLSGPLEPTNEWYAVAKIAGIKMCEAYRRQFGCDFISIMPTNLYGSNDNFALETSHVLPALMRKFHEAKLSGAREVVIWGSGRPRREFLHVDDLAEACLFLAQHYGEAGHVNIGWGDDIAISELARMIAGIVGFDGAITQDRSKPDGTPQKLLDVSVITRLGWRPKIALRDGIAQTYDWFKDRYDNASGELRI